MPPLAWVSAKAQPSHPQLLPGVHVYKAQPAALVLHRRGGPLEDVHLEPRQLLEDVGYREPTQRRANHCHAPRRRIWGAAGAGGAATSGGRLTARLCLGAGAGAAAAALHQRQRDYTEAEEQRNRAPRDQANQAI